ncbi:MAG: B12-binding domain-containing radical SAM protein [Theionarchaea archaeon]|nr:B12-binding domain-containing radical SAM protein [Theionarchaea archaeon]
MDRRLVLINPVNPKKRGLTMNVSSRFPPLGLGIVAALTPSTWEVHIIDENFEPFQYVDADLVGLTAFTASATRAYEIAGIYRERGTRTVLGGIHASMRPEEALQYVDTIVIGEAESAWESVITDFEAGNMKRIYQGERLDPAEIPFPRRELFHPGYTFGSIQTARGCPMDCEFCSVTAFNGRTYRQRPVERVLDELETISQKRVFFVDDNIIGYGKKAEKRALSLFKGMIERGIEKDWFCQASMNVGDNPDVLKYAALSGCRMVFLGVEAESAAVLHEVNKSLNIRMKDSYDEVFRRINNYGIAVLGAFIYGMDCDTPETLRYRTDYILKSGVDVMQTTYLTPLPGTRLFTRLQNENRLLYNMFPEDWDHYDMTEVTFMPQLMTPEDLKSAMDESSSRLYSKTSIYRKFFKTWRATKSFTTAMWAYTSNMNYRHVACTIPE